MPRNFQERRQLVRVAVDRGMTYTLNGEGTAHAGRVVNLSGRGMMFVAERALPVDAALEVHIARSENGEPPLHARVKVVRVVQQRRGDGYEVGAVIKEVLDE